MTPPMYYELLRAKIEDGSAVCGVVGLGYVGLPLAVEMGNVDLNVIGLDVSKRVVNDLNAGKSHIKDVPSADVARLRKAGRFEATTEMSRLAECDVISICVPTPLSKTKDPEMSYVDRRHGERRGDAPARAAHRARVHDVSRARRAS